MLKKVIGFLSVLLLAFSQGAFAEKWYEISSDSERTTFIDTDSIKEVVLDNGFVGAQVRGKILFKKEGFYATSIGEYKIKPLKPDAEGNFHPPIAKEYRILNISIYKLDGTMMGPASISPNAPWGKISGNIPLPLFAWYVFRAQQLGATKESTKLE